MKQLAVVLIAILIAGCSGTVRDETKTNSLLISMRSWQLLQVALQNSPEKLRSAITEAGGVRLQPLNQEVISTANDSIELKSALNDLFMHTRNSTLLTDAEFKIINYSATGNDINLQNSFAVALTGFLLNPEFGCQQPIYAAYFERRYAGNHVAATPCATEVPFTVLSQENGSQILWIDPRRIKSIHLLFAGKSQSMASRFGHLALRLVICPKGETASDVCDANLFEHLVLGFRAHIDELTLDSIKALTGEYKAYLYANKFMDVYKEYAIDEFREIYSIPLQLDDAQREMMVRELAEIHWGFSGSYSFLTRNCATMMQNGLRASWPEFAMNDSMEDNYLRPDHLFEEIKSGPLADGSKLLSLEMAERYGYYFSSTRPIYESALKLVRAAMQKPDFTDIESYLKIQPVIRLRSCVNDVKYFSKISKDKYLREAQILLEEYATLRNERLLMVEGTKYLVQQNFVKKSDAIRSQLDEAHARVFDDCLVSPLNQRSSPMQNFGRIPDKQDLPDISRKPTLCHSPENRKLLHEVIAGIKDAESEQWNLLNDVSRYYSESIENVNFLKEM